jgi:hypothetical protein
MIKLILAWIGIAMILTALIWAIAYVFGTNKLEKDYMKEYTDLYNLVYSGEVTAENFFSIIEKIIAIQRYECRDKEHIEVLITAFKRIYLPKL